jgi:3',5'-cyclic-AMP phosphodiesterase
MLVRQGTRVRPPGSATMTTEFLDPNRRGFLKCMTWAGSAMIWTVAGGVPRSHVIGPADAAETGFTFAQVSDSHLGFDKPVNADVTGTFQKALEHVTSVEDKPAFIIHTGDIAHLSTPARSC